MKRKSTIILGLLMILVQACGADSCSSPVEDKKKETQPEKADVKSEATEDKEPTGFTSKKGRKLLVTQSNFAQDDKGKYVVPDSAEMMIFTAHDGDWKFERIVDKESNVFHKAMQYGDEGIITIGANEAILKLWNFKDDKWKSQVLWKTEFGGKHNRLRDFEQADFNGDGKNELAIVTHDQGVVVVGWNRNGKWEFEELDKKANTFVHEAEIGDVDGDGNLEIYTTPSEPNTASGVDQGGGILRYKWTGEGFEKSEVVHYDDRHIKEIMVADVDEDGKDELYAVLEAKMGEGFRIVTPVEIVRFDYKDGKYVPTPVVTLQGERFCRFLVAGDITHNGKKDIVAASFSTGIWLIEKEGDEYKKTQIDANSGGFEHATYMADLNGDGKLELYVADDKNGELKQYIYVDGKFEGAVMHKRLVPSSTMVWNITTADL